MRLVNSFSLNMLSVDALSSTPFGLHVTQLTLDQAKDLLGANLKSCIGHADTAAVVGSILNRTVPMNRETVQMGTREGIIVAQYIGPRLPEGSTTLPDGAEIKFMLVTTGTMPPIVWCEDVYHDGEPWPTWVWDFDYTIGQDLLDRGYHVS